MTFPKKVPVLGVGISATNYPDVLDVVSRCIVSKERIYICVSAVHLVMECQNSPSLLRGVNQSAITTPDGMPLVWILKHRGESGVERVYGPTLMLKLCVLAEEKGWSVILLGGAPGQSKELKNKLQRRFPKIRIVGTIDTPNKIVPPRAVTEINKKHVSIVIVGLGCPFQEEWMIQNRVKLNAPVLIGVGAAFNFLTGQEKQAPVWAQNIGLEWLFRLTQNPINLWQRYILLNTQFLWKLLIQNVI